MTAAPVLHTHQRSVQVGARQIHLSEFGAGPALLMLHGGGPGASGVSNYAHNIQALAQSFRAGAGPVFTVVANHFKSKGCSNATGADADQHDGQSCWNAVRTTTARRLDAWLAETCRLFDGRIIPVDIDVAEEWGRMSASDPPPVIDGLLAATAVTRGLTLATRNTADIERTGVSWVNPFG